MTIKQLLVGFLAGVVSLGALVLVVGAVNRPVDALSLVVMAVLVVGVGVGATMRSRRREDT